MAFCSSVLGRLLDCFTGPKQKRDEDVFDDEDTSLLHKPRDDEVDLNMTTDSIENIIEPQLKALEDLDPDLLGELESSATPRRGGAGSGVTMEPGATEDLLDVESNLDRMIASLDAELDAVSTEEVSPPAAGGARRRGPAHS